MKWKSEALRRLAYQASTEQAGTGALLLTHNATAADAVVDELVLLGETLTGVSAWEYDRQPVLSFFVVQINKLVFLFGWGDTSTLLGLEKHANRKKEPDRVQSCNSTLVNNKESCKNGANHNLLTLIRSTGVLTASGSSSTGLTANTSCLLRPFRLDFFWVLVAKSCWST